MASDHWQILAMTTQRGLAAGLREHLGAQRVPVRTVLDHDFGPPQYVVLVPERRRSRAEKVLRYFDPSRFIDPPGPLSKPRT